LHKDHVVQVEIKCEEAFSRENVFWILLISASGRRNCFLFNMVSYLTVVALSGESPNLFLFCASEKDSWGDRGFCGLL
jgi:hypothetical protein